MTAMPARLGPRPLPLHLATAINAWMSSRAALTALNSGSLPWRPELAARASELADQLAAARNASRETATEATADGAFAAAVDTEVHQRLGRLASGIVTYRHHPYRRALAAPPVLWQAGTTKLLDYRPAGGRPVLFVPSLVNRAYVLDLAPGRSLLRWLADRPDGTGGALRPLLVDWDAPGAEERAFDLTDYVADRLDGALDVAVELAGGPVPVVGYCMGGLLALALAGRRDDAVRRLALLATPWDFHAERAGAAHTAAAALEAALPALDALGELPVDVVQALFYTLDPFLVIRKFLRFAELDPASARARDFVALEDWLNDGVGLALPTAAGCILGWYGENASANGTWRIAGTPVRPGDARMPALVLVPQRDRIVPPASARALADALPDATVRTHPLGHIGMVAGSRAPAAVWDELAGFLGAG